MDLGTPFGYPIQTYIWVIGLACIAGAVKYVNYSVTTKSFALITLLKDMLTGGLSGLMSFWLCESLGIGSPKNAIIISIAGIMGSRAWEEFEQIIRSLTLLAAEKTKKL